MDPTNEDGAPLPSLETKTEPPTSREASFYKDDKALLDSIDRLGAATTGLRRFLSGENSANDARPAIEAAAQLTENDLKKLLANHTTHEQNIIDHQTKLESMRASMLGSEEQVHVELITAKLELAEVQSELMNLRSDLAHMRRNLEDPELQAERAILHHFAAADASAQRLESAKVMRKALVGKLEGRNAVLAEHRAKVAKLEQRLKDLDGDW